MGRNIKQHNKKVYKKIITFEGKKYPHENFELVQSYNNRGGNPKMLWVSKDWSVRFPKIPGDVSILDE